MSRVAPSDGDPVIPDDRAAMSPARKRRIWEARNGKCWLCGMPVPQTGPEVRYDHRIPLELGGSDAEDTKVGVDQSQLQAKKLLRAAGADQIAVYESGEQSAVAFRVDGRFYRITIPVSATAQNKVQEEKRAWRLLLLLLKAKLEAVREGATTIEREFLADMLMPDGSTVGEWASPQLAVAYERGEMPSQLLLSGPKKP